MVHMQTVSPTLQVWEKLINTEHFRSLPYCKQNRKLSTLVLACEMEKRHTFLRLFYKKEQRSRVGGSIAKFIENSRVLSFLNPVRPEERSASSNMKMVRHDFKKHKKTRKHHVTKETR